MSRKPYKFTAPKRALVLKAIAKGTTRTAAMEAVGLHRSALSHTMKRDPEFAQLVEAAEMPVHEAVESSLLKSAMSGNVTAQIFYLCNRAKERWTHVNQVRVDTKVDIHVGAEQALQAKIMSMGMAGLTEPEEEERG